MVSHFSLNLLEGFLFTFRHLVVPECVFVRAFKNFMQVGRVKALPYTLQRGFRDIHCKRNTSVSESFSLLVLHAWNPGKIAIEEIAFLCGNLEYSCNRNLENLVLMSLWKNYLLVVLKRTLKSTTFVTTLRNMEKLTLLKSLLTDSLVKREGLDLLHLMTMILWIKSYVSNLHVTVPSDNTNAYSHGNCMKLNF